MPRLVISSAHTSLSPGSKYKDLTEFAVAKKILQKAIPYLEKNKIEFKTVPVDIPLFERIKWINKSGFNAKDGDLFIEIHVNDGGKRGFEGWFSGKDQDGNNSKTFSKFIVDELAKITGYDNQGVKSEYDHDLGSLLVLNQTEQISTAVEFLYIDNEEDYALLKDDSKLDELGKALADAVKKWTDNPPKLNENDSSQVKKDPSKPFGGVPLPKTANNPALSPLNPKPFGNSNSNAGVAPPALGGSQNASNSSSGSSNMIMDRDERKKMIEKNYKKYLGKEPKPADMSYYLNSGISEDELLKKIITSKEHEELVKDAKEAEEIRKEKTKLESDKVKFENRARDLEAMMRNLQELLKHKDGQLRQMHEEMQRRGVIRQGEYFDPNRVNPPATSDRPYQ